MSEDAIRLSAYSRLFSSTVIRELAVTGKSSLFRRLVEQSLLHQTSHTLSCVGDAFQAAFEVLRIGERRDEYIYKAALIEKVLLGRHSLKTASMLTEFRVGECKADLAILNGTATVYEIKSERDSLSRLKKQLSAYKTVFAKVYVIAGERHTQAVLHAADPEVGVLQLSSRHTISTIREAIDRVDAICPVAVFDSIRVQEAARILSSLDVDIPDLPNTLIRAEMRRMFSELTPADVHAAMVSTLKKTRNLASLNDFVQALPSSLRAAVLSIPLKKSEQQQLLSTLNSDFHDVLSWS